MVHRTVLLLKPTVKYTAKWLLRSLQGFPKCAWVSSSSAIKTSALMLSSPNLDNPLKSYPHFCNFLKLQVIFLFQKGLNFQIAGKSSIMERNSEILNLDSDYIDTKSL